MRRKSLQNILVALCLALAGAQGGYTTYAYNLPKGEAMHGIVMHVTDGDTLRLNGVRVRIWGVDAPEAGQKGYDEATRVLRDGAWMKSVSCTIRDRDRHGRIVAQCFQGKRDIGAAVIRSGWARDYTRHSNGFYLKEETQARKERIGLWRR